MASRCMRRRQRRSMHGSSRAASTAFWHSHDLMRSHGAVLLPRTGEVLQLPCMRACSRRLFPLDVLPPLVCLDSSWKREPRHGRSHLTRGYLPCWMSRVVLPNRLSCGYRQPRWVSDSSAHTMRSVVARGNETIRSKARLVQPLQWTRSSSALRCIPIAVCSTTSITHL